MHTATKYHASNQISSYCTSSISFSHCQPQTKRLSRTAYCTVPPPFQSFSNRSPAMLGADSTGFPYEDIWNEALQEVGIFRPRIGPVSLLHPLNILRLISQMSFSLFAVPKASVFLFPSRGSACILRNSVSSNRLMPCRLFARFQLVSSFADVVLVSTPLVAPEPRERETGSSINLQKKGKM